MKKRYSLLTRVTLLLIPTMLLAVFTLLFLPTYTRFRLREEVVSLDRDSIMQQVQVVDNQLRLEENFLINTFQSNGDMIALRRNSQSVDTPNHVYRVRELLSSRQSQGDGSEIYFLILEDAKQSAYVTTGNLPEDERNSLAQYFETYPISPKMTSIPWNLLRIGNQTYCMRSLCRDGVCIGGIVRVTTLLGKLHLSDGEVSLLDQNSKPVTNIDWLLEHKISLDGLIGNDYLLTGSPDDYITIQVPFETFNGSIVYFVSDKEVLGPLNQTILFLRILGIFVGIILILSLIYYHSTLRHSLARLKNAILALQQHDMQSRIDITSTSKEFGEVYDTFNKMVDAIHFFRIKSYEEELQKKNFQLQYYSLQVKPHFYLNSLKFLYALAEKEDYRSIQKMLLDLSDYYQYITYDSEKLIPLESELRHTATYVMIRETGIKQHTNCILDIDIRAKKYLVPGLCVQTFVENSLKYSGLPPEHLKIQIQVSVRVENNQNYLDIVVLDNGKGYDQDVLDAFSGDEPKKLEGHAGLDNLWHRLSLIYEHPVKIKLQNLPNGGAYSAVSLPVTPVKEEKYK